VGEIGPDDPKTRWPYQCSAQGLLFGNRQGVLLLRRTGQPLARVVLVEGITDTMAASLAMRAEPVAVLGVTSGSAAVLRDIAWPSGVPVAVWTDEDAAGEKYAAEIAAAVPSHIRITRLPPEEKT
jgi:DNA primase